MRSGQNIQSFENHVSDVNCVKWVWFLNERKCYIKICLWSLTILAFFFFFKWLLKYCWAPLSSIILLFVCVFRYHPSGDAFASASDDATVSHGGRTWKPILNELCSLTFFIEATKFPRPALLGVVGHCRSLFEYTIWVFFTLLIIFFLVSL